MLGVFIVRWGPWSLRLIRGLCLCLEVARSSLVRGLFGQQKKMCDVPPSVKIEFGGLVGQRNSEITASMLASLT